MNVQTLALNVGDRLVRTKGGIFSAHHAVFAGVNPYTGERLVAENQTGFGVRIISLSQFLNEGRLLRIEHNNFSLLKQQEIIERIRVRLGSTYDFLRYNCEHFVNDVLYANVSSKQVKTGLSIGAGLVALWFFFSS